MKNLATLALIVGLSTAASMSGCERAPKNQTSQPTTQNELVENTLSYYHFKENDPARIMYGGKELIVYVDEKESIMRVAGYRVGEYKAKSESGTPITQVRPVSANEQQDITKLLSKKGEKVTFWGN